MILTHVLRRIIWHPRDKGDLAALALSAIGIVLDIKDGVSATHNDLTLLVLALGVEKLLAELGVVWVRRRLLDDNLLPIVGDLVDDPLGRLAELQVVERLDAFGCDGDAVFVLLSVASSLYCARCRLEGECRRSTITYPDCACRVTCQRLKLFTQCGSVRIP